MERPDPPDGECITGKGALTKNGYRKLWFRIDGVVKQPYAHRVAWEQANGPIPEGMTIDHLCRNRECSNVNHMEVVTQKVNVLRGQAPSAQHARKTHCIKGHEFNKQNTYVTPTGARQCKTCSNEAHRRRYRSRKKEMAS